MNAEIVPSFNCLNESIDLPFIEGGGHRVRAISVDDRDVDEELDSLAETVGPNDDELVECFRRNVRA